MGLNRDHSDSYRKNREFLGVAWGLLPESFFLLYHLPLFGDLLLHLFESAPGLFLGGANLLMLGKGKILQSRCFKIFFKIFH